MFTLSKTVRFEAAHRLPMHDGKCARLHGHSWKATVEITGSLLIPTGPQQAMLMDYGRLGAPLKLLVEERLDHYHLNESLGLENPTSEAIAVWIYEQLVGSERYGVKLPRGCFISAVVVEETCTSSCRYAPPYTNIPATTERR